MGFFDFLSGRKRPKSGVVAVSPDALQAAILAVNRDTAPFQITKCTDGSCDLLAEWKIVDAKWYEIFGKAGLKKAFTVKMRLDADKSEVRAVDQDYTVSWKAGVPVMELQAAGFRGQKTEMSFGTAYAFTEEFKPGQVYNYRFNSAELKKPLQQAVTDNGWTWHGVSFGKL